VTVPGGTYALVYDGDCSVCNRVVRRLEQWDQRGRIEIIPSQRQGVHARFPWIPGPAYAESMQLVRVSDGRTWQGAAAVEELLTVLPRGRWIAWVFAVPLVRGVADRLYRWFARNRYHLGCREHCQSIPEGRKADSRDGS
jgi:predicted DCC family thiol-disulfide oxidoreductase YuxK